MITIPIPLQQFIDTKVQRLAVAFRIARVDGTIFRFTTGDENVDILGQTYTPTDGVTSSETTHQFNLRSPRSANWQGALDDSSIKHDDLRAGLFRRATVTEYIYNWQHPYLGPIRTNVGILGKISFNGEIWECNFLGLTQRLSGQIGELTTRLCPYIVGDSDCTVSLTTDNAAITTIDDQRLTFKASALAGTQSDDYYNLGVVTFTAGNNNALAFEVKDYTDVDGTIVLRNPTPFDFTLTTDTFGITPGCDGTRGTCKDKFSNLVRHGGLSFLPGQNETIKPLL